MRALAIVGKLLIGLLLGAAIAFTARWLYFSQSPKTPAIAFDGAHGNEFLNASCVSLQQEHDRLARLPIKEKFDQMYYSPNRHLPCQSPAKEMYVIVEGQLMTAFAANPMCEGIKFSQGYYGPTGDKEKDAQPNKDFLAAEWRLSLDLVASPQTGSVALEPSHWTLSPTSRSGSLLSMDKAAADICAVVKSKAGQ
jgi:hypothetical protein